MTHFPDKARFRGFQFLSVLLTIPLLNSCGYGVSSFYPESNASCSQLISWWDGAHSSSTSATDFQGSNTASLSSISLFSDSSSNVFLLGSGSLFSVANSSSLSPTTATTVQAWVKLKQGIKTPITQTLLSKGTYPTAMTAGQFSAFDTTTVNASAKGFASGAYDGRYLYLSPYVNGGISGIVTRYDTTLDFATGTSWTTFDTTTVSANAKGFQGAVFDGRYVYLVPYKTAGATYSGIIARYDTTLDFGTSTSWKVFDISTVNAGAKGFYGGVFDGKYLYLVPYYNSGPDFSGVIARYDTTLDFSTTTSWKAFDVASVNANAKGFNSGVFDGRYLYLIPYSNNNSFYDGIVARYDATLDFSTGSSWTTFDTTSVNANAKGFLGGSFDGRYLYLVPNMNGAYNGIITRYDTTLDFGTGTSWTTFDTTTINANAKGFQGSIFDGRYLYLVPNNNGASHGNIVRYDTTLTFGTGSSWSTFDTTGVNASAKGFSGAVFDGKYVYFIPGMNTTPQIVARYDSKPGFSIELNAVSNTSDGAGYSAMGPSFRVNTTSGSVAARSTSLLDSNWHLVTGVYDRATVKLYVDGALIGSQVLTGSINTNTSNLYIGSAGGSTSAINGYINEIQFYSQALSQSEIQVFYASGQVGGLCR